MTICDINLNEDLFLVPLVRVKNTIDTIMKTGDNNYCRVRKEKHWNLSKTAIAVRFDKQISH